MPRFTGILAISAGVSELDGTTLAKAPLTGNPFGRATNFLRQDRSLQSGNRIWVDGAVSTIGNVKVIVITDAGLALPAIVGVNGTLEAVSAAKKSGSTTDRKDSSSGRKTGTKKGAKKKSSRKKSTAKKSTRKQTRR